MPEMLSDDRSSNDETRPGSYVDEDAPRGSGHSTALDEPEKEKLVERDGKRDEARRPTAEEAAAADAAAESPLEDRGEAALPFDLRDSMRGISACLVSMLVHAALLVVLGMLVFEDAIKAEVQTLLAAAVEEPRPEDEPVEIELSEEIETVTEQTLAVFSASPAAGLSGPAAALGTPQLDQKLVENVTATEVYIEAPTVGMPDSVGLIETVPDGEVKGEPRDIVGSYQQAMDRLAQEFIWMLDRGPVLAIWLFDQSNSMKDDQQEIRDRIENVYNQLGIVGENNSDALLTAVSSYGQGFQVHTKRPTKSRDEIRQAIDAIPVDPTGKEMMCQAVGRAIAVHRKYAGRNRQMALILVADESGEPENNDRFLEAAIMEAKDARCKIFGLGREAIFGYPYAYLRWRHPQTERVHYLQMDRGPETAFPEQLQTNGFRRRGDSFPSGFGPYEQSRMARETNGIFFMLPSVEEDLTGRGNQYDYDLEAMRPFLPDLRARISVLQDRDKHPLRSLIWKVISDLNPYQQKVVEIEDSYPLQLEELVANIRENQNKAKLLIRYMAEARTALEEGSFLREQEPSPRWQANYDLIYAQLIAYQARLYEFGVGMDAFLNNWQAETQKHPPRTSPTNVLLRWHLDVRGQTLTEESKPYQEEATTLLQRVAEDFRGTPWGARAEGELQRGYGVYLRPYYDRPVKEVKKPIPVPKL